MTSQTASRTPALGGSAGRPLGPSAAGLAARAVRGGHPRAWPPPRCRARPYGTGTRPPRGQVVEAHEVDVVAGTVLRGLQQIHHTLEARAAGQRRGDVGEGDG